MPNPDSLFSSGTEMNALQALFDSLSQLGHSIWDLLGALLAVLLPWTPLAAWIVFWMFAVNWVKLRETLAKGGWVGLALLGTVIVLVWGNVSPGDGTFDFFGLRISNFVEKVVYVSGMFVIMFLAGALQLSGFCSGCCPFNEPVQIAESHGHAAGESHAPAPATDDGHGHG
jgi:hypothetical protein